MTEEQKQALIEHIETDLELWRNVTLKYCHECERDDVLRDIKVNEIALAALTAQPDSWQQRAEAAEAHVEAEISNHRKHAAILISERGALRERAEAAEAKLAELEKQELSAEVKLYRQENIIPEGLNRSTAELVLDFAKALAEKLHRSEQKYGWSDGWKESDWQDKCLADFHHHIVKGDPRDVAAYCAFMWYHGWSTNSVPEGDEQ